MQVSRRQLPAKTAPISILQWQFFMKLQSGLILWMNPVRACFLRFVVFISDLQKSVWRPISFHVILFSSLQAGLSQIVRLHRACVPLAKTAPILFIFSGWSLRDLRCKLGQVLSSACLIDSVTAWRLELDRLHSVLFRTVKSARVLWISTLQTEGWRQSGFRACVDWSSASVRFSG